jgi:hypothetical protein
LYFVPFFTRPRTSIHKGKTYKVVPKIWGEWTDRQHGMTHIPTTPCSKKQAMIAFKLKSLKSRNDSDIMIDMENATSIWTSDESNFVKATHIQSKARSRDRNTTRPSLRSKDDNISDYFPQHRVSTHLDLSRKTCRIGF